MLLVMRNYFRAGRRTLPLGGEAAESAPPTKQNVGSTATVRAREVDMDFDSCFNCGQQGHFASSCPLDQQQPSTRHPAQWKPAPRRDRAEQAAINEWGVALCRAALNNRP